MHVYTMHPVYCFLNLGDTWQDVRLCLFSEDGNQGSETIKTCWPSPSKLKSRA